ncbi:intermembrane phospholipid transport protein YdbH family protein [Sphingobium nicotianae]|uniref:YdbH domain-containing protein n=1 Tax=Sphingobium nicotianae TaxID=2782607 RepID=A0A9X1AIE6_9SPHN|nr:YdbH domain-containing protein [Sphingobium nicotianae]MBT2185842.1 YdbH domain-containing protein [Sphingobium nicotianae]
MTNLAQDAELLADEAGKQPRRFRRARRIGGGIALVLALAGGALYLARKPIADSFIARELAARGVQGRYVVTRIGPRTQRLDNLVIGDPRSPDLTVRFVEVDIGWGLGGARITRVQASGVRLRGRLHEGTLDLGQVTRLLQGSTGRGEARLPDWTVELDDARADIASDLGALQFALQGRGPVRSGFGGTLSVASSGLQIGDCQIERPRAPLDVSTQDERILLIGPVSAPMLVCGDTLVAAPKLDFNLRSDIALQDMSGAVTLYADDARQAARRLDKLSGLVTFKGKAADLRGSASVSAAHVSIDGVETGAAKIGGNFALRASGDTGLAWTGVATVDNAHPAKGIDMGALVRAAAGTPLEPLAGKLAKAIAEIGKGNRLVLGGAVNLLGSRGNAALDRLELTARSGARVRATDGSAVKFNWPDGALAATGTIALSGGGLPEGKIAFAADEKGMVRGRATLADYAAGTARLRLTPVDFAIDRRGAGQVRTTLTLDGPLPDGQLTGLTAPVDARFSPDGSVRLAGSCAPVRWTAVRLSSLALDPATVRLCGIDNGDIRIDMMALTGRIGASPLAFKAASARYALGAGQFELAAPDVRIGPADNPVRLAANRLVGMATPRGGGLAGTFEGGAGRIGAVPLDLTELAGRWAFRNGRLDVDGGLRVADVLADPRFRPLAGRDVHLTLADGRIDATGMLVHPTRQVRVAAVTIRHDLSSGAGQADIKLDNLRFGGALQPDDLTSLALGVIANVDGVVEGQGQIRWTAEHVTSDGTFSTKGMSFAAAFGPVTNFATTIHFADLLGMRTLPGQVMTVGSINPGIEVTDGTIHYALLSSQQARIEGGQWPFSGGTLSMLPATLDLDAKKPRKLTFRVVGLEAGAFINTLELDNISATGTFDGLLPMVFDETGGRIEGGLLVARQQGNPPLILQSTQGLDVPCDPARQSGNLAYVGEVSNAQLGAYGKLAFDALKNLRYRCLAIMLDGALDGEFVTRLTINGVNQGTEEAKKSFISRPFLGLPFIFNIRIEAPFRGLLNTATGLADPRRAVSDALRNHTAPVITDEGRLAVQPVDSDKRIKGEPK